MFYCNYYSIYKGSLQVNYIQKYNYFVQKSSFLVKQNIFLTNSLGLQEEPYMLHITLVF